MQKTGIEIIAIYSLKFTAKRFFTNSKEMALNFLQNAFGANSN